MADPFTIRIFVPDGDPEGVRLIDRMNWTGLGVVFRRSDWQAVRNRVEFQRTGIYILVGYRQPDDDLPTLYIGQADGVRGRIDSHYANKDFWDWGVTFVSTSGGLNRAHVTWLEHALVARANEAGRCFLDNGNAPQEPAMTEAEKADTQGFLKEVLQILPLVGLRAFEKPLPVSRPETTTAEQIVKRPGSSADTVIVPAQKDGFEEVFLGQNAWHAIRISGGMLDKIKFIAAYQSAPISAITHVAPVKQIEPYGESGKYKLVFSEPALAIEPIPYGNAPSGAMQGPRYTTIERLRSAKTVGEILAR
jgi:hypothetical protein